jgi:hypothetical protein
MKGFYGAFVTTKGSEFLLCVFESKTACKLRFCVWYKNVDYDNVSVRYAPVSIKETTT